MYLTIDNHRIWIDIEGNGIPVFIPSTAGNVYFQRVFPKTLRIGYKLHFIEPGNFGRSDVYSEISLEKMSEEIETIRQYLGYKKIVLFGWSANGFISMKYALKYPEYVSHLVLVNAPPFYGKKLLDEQHKYFEKFANRKRKKIYENNLIKLNKLNSKKISVEQKIINQYVLFAPYYWYNPSYNCSYIWENNSLNGDSLTKYFTGILNNYDFTPNFEKLLMPVLYAAGKYDFMVPNHLIENVFHLIPNCEYQLFEKSGHFLFSEEKKKFTRLFNKFIEKNEV